MKAFLCHKSKDSAFTIELASHLQRCLDGVFYYEEYQRSDTSFVATINRALDECEVMVVVLGREFSQWQSVEANRAYQFHMEGKVRSFFLVQLPDAAGMPVPVPTEITMLSMFAKVTCEGPTSEEARRIAEHIVKKLGVAWCSTDDLPADPHLFSYEKDIIRFFTKRHQHGQECFDKAGPVAAGKEHDEFEKMRGKMLDGCPTTWPTVRKWRDDPDYKELFHPRAYSSMYRLFLHYKKHWL